MGFQLPPGWWGLTFKSNHFHTPDNLRWSKYSSDWASNDSYLLSHRETQAGLFHSNTGEHWQCCAFNFMSRTHWQLSCILSPELTHERQTRLDPRDASRNTTPSNPPVVQQLQQPLLEYSLPWALQFPPASPHSRLALAVISLCRRLTGSNKVSAVWSECNYRDEGPFYSSAGCNLETKLVKWSVPKKIKKAQWTGLTHSFHTFFCH